MSYELNLKPLFDSAVFGNSDASLPVADGKAAADELSDAAIDAALGAVALPAGLLMRLEKRAFAEADGIVDQRDWLGC